jgi:hypothetical protein
MRMPVCIAAFGLLEGNLVWLFRAYLMADWRVTGAQEDSAGLFLAGWYLVTIEP